MTDIQGEIKHVGIHGSRVAQALAVEVTGTADRSGNVELAAQLLEELRKLDDDAAETRMIRLLGQAGIQVHNTFDREGQQLVMISCNGPIGTGVSFKYEGGDLWACLTVLVSRKSEDVLGKVLREACISYINRIASSRELE